LNPNKSAIDKVENFLKEIFESKEEAEKTLEIPNCKNCKTMKDLAREAIANVDNIKNEDIKSDIKTILNANAGTYIGLTPNYILVNSIDYTDERESVKALLNLFRGALASRLFLCSAIVKEITFEPLCEYTPKGAVLTSMPLDLDQILDSINIKLVDSWLPFEKVDVYLKKFSCVILLGNYAWRENKGNYIYILTSPPGLTLNHIAMNEKGSLKKALNWLDVIFEEGKYATDVVYGR
jgi:hypothetical protein